jgi:TRAP-type C4-dicarboxylate transport system substrate-binding protein
MQVANETGGLVMVHAENGDAIDVIVKEAVAAGKKAQKYYEDKAEAVDAATIKAYKDHGVQIKSLSKAEYDRWIDVARKSSYAEFSKAVPNGKKLIDEAMAVK